MAKRTPVAFALGEQLALLQEYGYQVVPVASCWRRAPLRTSAATSLFDRLTALAQQRAIVFSDNRLRLDDPMTVGELAMLLAPKAETITRRVAQLRRTGRAGAYDGAMAWCRENGLVSEAAHPADRRDRAAGGVVRSHGQLYPPGCLCGVPHGSALSDTKTNSARTEAQSGAVAL